MQIQKCIFIKRRIEENDYIRNFIFFNINYRRNIWNKFVEEYYKCDENWKEFNINNLTSYITSTIDNDIKMSSDYYNVDIIKGVRRDVKNAMQRIKDRTVNEHRHFGLNFKKFDRYRGTFKVTSRNTIKNGRLRGKIHFKNNIELEYRAHKNNHFNIKLKEPFYDEKIDDTYCIYDKHDRELHYYFRHEDIKDVVFIHEMGKFYIALSVKTTYIINDEDIKNRKKLAGIDLGIHNPVTIYDGCNIFRFGLSEKELKKMRHLEKRCKKLQLVMDEKMRINLKRKSQDETFNIYSNNYEKVRKKFRRSWKRLADIRCNWRRKLAKFISTQYQVVIVDTMKQPTQREHKDIPRFVEKRFNHFNREHAMCLFTETLIHDCIKNGCIFIEAPKNTTRTCSFCGYKNDRLPLSKRTLKCVSCGKSIDRDINAAINCYKSLESHF